MYFGFDSSIRIWNVLCFKGIFMSAEVRVREALPDDWQFVRELMENALAPFYGGDHVAHAKRIFDTHIAGGIDEIGFFSQQQKMFVATIGSRRAGLVHVVLKRQRTCKISPLIVEEKFQREGVGAALLETAIAYSRENVCRQIYCTVSELNKSALNFFLRSGFIAAGVSNNQYLKGSSEIMLYRVLDEIVGDDEFDLDHISVLALEDSHREQVKEMLIENLQDDFIGIDANWVKSLFAGFDRREAHDVNEKYKLIFTAVDRNGRVLGVAGATPKKGEPIKLMPFVATESPAFFALLSDVPGLLREYGRKVYVHINPDAEQTRFLQRYGWHLDGMLPDAYQVERVTQQWSKELDGDGFMKQVRLKKRFLDMMKAGSKTLEVRVGYDAIKSLKTGDQIAFVSRDDKIVRDVKSINVYPNFDEMLRAEDYSRILPGMSLSEVDALLREIYPPNKEKLGVYVIEVG